MRILLRWHIPRMQALTRFTSSLSNVSTVHLPLSSFRNSLQPSEIFAWGSTGPSGAFSPKSLVIPTLKEFSLRSYIRNPEAETWPRSFPNLERFEFSNLPVPNVSFKNYQRKKLPEEQKESNKRRVPFSWPDLQIWNVRIQTLFEINIT